MKTLSVFNRRAGAVFATAALVLSTTVPALVSAATVTERSVETSTSTKGADATYTIKFTTQTAAAGGWAVDFCTTVDGTCTAPTGLKVTSGTSAISDGTLAVVSDNKISVTKTLASAASIDVDLTHVTNPSAAGTVYARITTHAASGDLPLRDDPVDKGVAAFGITDGIEVSGAVLESLIFCASGAALVQTDCSDTTAPKLSLGTAGVLTDDASDGVGHVYTLLTSNAVGGVSVNLKSDATGCGGLYLEGKSPAAGCNISPVGTTAIALDSAEAKFGAKFTLIQGTGATLALNTTNGWSTSNYSMNYVALDASGVTSVYGDEVLSVNGPVANAKAQVDFGANAAPLTPAGKYVANLSLIATGKF